MSYPPRTPSRASTFASQDSKISSAQHAALSGATKAFGRPLPPQRTSSDAKIGGGNGTLAAAATVGSRQSSPQGRQMARSPPRPLVTSSTGGSIQSVHRDALRSGRVPNLQPPAQSTREQHSKSPSLQAASLAASRATPQSQSTQIAGGRPLLPQSASTRRPAAPPKPRRFSGKQHEGIKSAENAKLPTDETPIPPTTSLVSLFERKASQPQSSTKRPEPIVIKPSSDLPIKSPKPVRAPSGGLTSVFHMELPNAKGNSFKNEESRSVPSRDSSPESFASASETPTAPASPDTIVDSRAAMRRTPSERTGTGHRNMAKPNPPYPPRPRTATSRPLHVKQPPPRSSTAMSGSLSPSSASQKSLPAQYKQLYPRAKAPQMTGDQLANAMVASSLASTRSSPQHSEPPAPPSRKQRQVFGYSRTPSPTKGGFKHTLRKADSDSESEDEDMLHPYGKHKRKRHLRKHPNKHREGDRKRWRDAVTERERKRYEGVWAANKGLHCSMSAAEQAINARSSRSDEARQLESVVGEQISNLVARDIWSRSNLSDITLETIWDLVDHDCVGRLTKDEFVVGMFLVDYCLKGRKLPGRVSESVWASVRGLQGIKIRKSY